MNYNRVLLILGEIVKGSLCCRNPGVLLKNAKIPWKLQQQSKNTTSTIQNYTVISHFVNDLENLLTSQHVKLFRLLDCLTKFLLLLSRDQCAISLQK